MERGGFLQETWAEPARVEEFLHGIEGEKFLGGMVQLVGSARC